MSLSSFEVKSNSDPKEIYVFNFEGTTEQARIAVKVYHLVEKRKFESHLDLESIFTRTNPTNETSKVPQSHQINHIKIERGSEIDRVGTANIIGQNFNFIQQNTISASLVGDTIFLRGK